MKQLRELEDWRRQHTEPEVMFVPAAALVYGAIQSLAPTEELRRAAIRGHLTMLKTTPLRRDEPQVWLMLVETLIRTAQINKVDEEWFRLEAGASGEGLIPLYLELANLLPRR